MGPPLVFSSAPFPKILNSKPSRPAQEQEPMTHVKKKNSAINLMEKEKDEGKIKRKETER